MLALGMGLDGDREDPVPNRRLCRERVGLTGGPGQKEADATLTERREAVEHRHMDAGLDLVSDGEGARLGKDLVSLAPRRSRPNVHHGSRDRFGRITRDLALDLPSMVRRSRHSSPCPGPSLGPCPPDPFHLLLAFRSPPFHCRARRPT